MAAGHPLQGMDIAQAAGTAFDIRLQVVASAVIALVALILLFHFGCVKLVGRPETFAKNMLLQLQKQRHIADQQASFNQVGGDG